MIITKKHKENIQSAEQKYVIQTRNVRNEIIRAELNVVSLIAKICWPNYRKTSNEHVKTPTKLLLYQHIRGERPRDDKKMDR